MPSAEGVVGIRWETHGVSGLTLRVLGPGPGSIGPSSWKMGQAKRADDLWGIIKKAVIVAPTSLAQGRRGSPRVRLPGWEQKPAFETNKWHSGHKSRPRDSLCFPKPLSA